jgi:GT2 family glycosyltransferase
MVMKLIYTIIVTYNGMKWIEECLNSVLNSSIPVSIIVVDNNSTDGTQEFIKTNFSDIILLEQNCNLGFGKANNIGMSYALKYNTDFVFLLNQDAKIDKETIEQLVKVSLENKEYGILSPLHLNWEGDDIEFGFYNESLFKDLLLKNQIKEIYNEKKFINASAWLLPLNTLNTVGGFDPIFFHYGEDVNYCQRIIYHKLKLAVVPNVKIYHETPNNGVLKITDKITSQKVSDRYFRNQTLIKYANVNLKEYKSYSKFKKKIFLRILYYLLMFDFKKSKEDLRYYKILKNLNIKESYFQNKIKQSNYL